jgi:DNA-binding LacI/PurR family transcriptional regulator
MSPKVTIHDVARAAKLSPSTVWRVAAGETRVSNEKRERVKQVATELGFDLRRNHKTKVLAFLLCNREILHPFPAHVLAGTESHCTSCGASMLFQSVHYAASIPWQDLHLPAILLRRDLVRGFIVAGVNSANLLTLLSRKQAPFVVLGNNVLGEWAQNDFDVVWYDDIQGAFEMTLYLESLGHREIRYVGSCHLPWFARRFEGYRRAMTKAGLTPHVHGFESENEEDIGYLGIKSILSAAEPVSAIFAGSDLVAKGVYRALQDHGMRIPEDISVVGCNDIEASLLQPALTSIRTFSEQVGKHLAEIVLNRIEHPDLPPQQCTIPCQLIKRESCLAYSERAEGERTPIASHV